MKPKYLLAQLFLLIALQLPSQSNPTVFSGNPEDSLRVMHRLKQARQVYSRQQYDSVILLTENILEISLETGFLRGAGESYLLKARALNRQGRREKAIEMYQFAVKEFQNINDHLRIASTYNNWGLTLKALGRFREAIETGEKALNEVRLSPTDKLQFHILNNLGNSYQNLALFKKASSAYFEALQVLKKEPDSLYKQQMQAEVYINLGLIYYEQKLYPKSQEIYEEALKFFERQKTKPQLATIYNNMGILFTRTQDFTKAMDYLERAYKLCINLNNNVEATVCKANSGKVFLAQKKYNRAISTYEKAIKEFNRLKAPAYLPSSYLGLGETFIEAGILDKAEISLLKGLQIALKSGQKIKELKLYEGLISFHKSVGELEMALMYYDLYSALSHELNDQQIGRYIGQLELKEHLEKRDLVLKSLESQAAFLQFKLNQRNVLLILSLAVIILVSGFFALVLRQSRLKAQHKSMALEQKILRTQLNPHFIFNALGAIQHYMIDHNPDKAASYLSKFSKLMRCILECSRISQTTLAVELENMRHYLDLQSLRFTNSFDYSIQVDHEIQPDCIKVPSLIIQPLLENAIEHGLLPNKGGQLTISIEKGDNQIIIKVLDDGVGLAGERVVQTVKQGNTSLGNTITIERLSLINRCSKNKFGFKVRNRADIQKGLSGTMASISIPINQK